MVLVFPNELICDVVYCVFQTPLVSCDVGPHIHHKKSTPIMQLWMDHEPFLSLNAVGNVKCEPIFSCWLQYEVIPSRNKKSLKWLASISVHGPSPVGHASWS